MQISEIAFEDQPPIDGYGPGGFRIAGTWYDGALVVSPAGVAPLADGLAGLLPLGAWAGKVDVVLVGQGPEIAPVPAPLRAAFEAATIGVEPMSTPSACRTYNVLLAEDRRVAAVLLPI